MLNVASKDSVVAYLKASRSITDWNLACSEISKQNGGVAPEWFERWIFDGHAGRILDEVRR